MIYLSEGLESHPVWETEPWPGHRIFILPLGFLNTHCQALGILSFKKISQKNLRITLI